MYVEVRDDFINGFVTRIVWKDNYGRDVCALVSLCCVVARICSSSAPVELSRKLFSHVTPSVLYT